MEQKPATVGTWGRSPQSAVTTVLSHQDAGEIHSATLGSATRNTLSVPTLQFRPSSSFRQSWVGLVLLWVSCLVEEGTGKGCGHLLSSAPRTARLCKRVLTSRGRSQTVVTPGGDKHLGPGGQATAVLPDSCWEVTPLLSHSGRPDERGGALRVHRAPPPSPMPAGS